MNEKCDMCTQEPCLALHFIRRGCLPMEAIEKVEKMRTEFKYSLLDIREYLNKEAGVTDEYCLCIVDPVI